LSTVFAAGCIAEEHEAYVGEVPEQDATEVVDVASAPGSAYAPAHWEWNGSRYVWARARFLVRPQPNAHWVEAHWQSSPRGWYWQEGHWIEARPARAHRHLNHAPTPTVPPEPPEGAGPQEEGAPAADPNVPPAPTYAPPPPPATMPPPPPGAMPQHYLQQPQPSVGY